MAVQPGLFYYPFLLHLRKKNAFSGNTISHLLLTVFFSLFLFFFSFIFFFVFFYFSSYISHFYITPPPLFPQLTLQCGHRPARPRLAGLDERYNSVLLDLLLDAEACAKKTLCRHDLAALIFQLHGDTADIRYRFTEDLRKTETQRTREKAWDRQSKKVPDQGILQDVL